jgi:uncharacterized Zn-binding protein involved in type VI secretion
MVRQVIVAGDTLAPHGGTVTTGSNADIVYGKPVARKGDTVECGEHGTQTIVEGDEHGMFGGAPVALHGLLPFEDHRSSGNRHRSKRVRA